jgi:hypothetical protein
MKSITFATTWKPDNFTTCQQELNNDTTIYETNREHPQRENTKQRDQLIRNNTRLLSEFKVQNHPRKEIEYYYKNPREIVYSSFSDFQQIK